MMFISTRSPRPSPREAHSWASPAPWAFAQLPVCRAQALMLTTLSHLCRGNWSRPWQDEKCHAQEGDCREDVLGHAHRAHWASLIDQLVMNP